MINAKEAREITKQNKNTNVKIRANKIIDEIEKAIKIQSEKGQDLVIFKFPEADFKEQDVMDDIERALLTSYYSIVKYSNYTWTIRW